MGDESRPETPEETLARLAASAASPESPEELSPYRAADPSVDPAPRTGKRTGLVVGLVVLLLVVGGTSVGAFFALREDAIESGLYQPLPFEPEAPAAEGDWANYPGVSYLDDAEVLAGPRLEEMQAEATRFAQEYQSALTAEFGLTWSERYASLLNQNKNGYGGTSLLYYYSSPEWQGSAKVTDPQARQKVEELFHRLALDYGSTDYYLANEFPVDDAAIAKQQFGAAGLAKQPMWEMAGDHVIGQSIYMHSKVLDRSLPIDRSWEGDIWFDFDEAGSDNLVVTLRIHGIGMLSQKDEAEYRDRLEEYDLSAKPRSR